MAFTFLARRFDTTDSVRITVVDHSITTIEPAEVPGSAPLPFVAPGFFDIQVNGWGGTWFSRADLSPDDVARVVEQLLPHGVTRFLPTLITNSSESLKAGFEAVAAACDRFPLAADSVVGCHLEGPYISPEDGPRGAHPKAHVRPADWDEFRRLQDASGGRIRLATLAPEVPGAIDFIRKAVAAGVVIAIGHTAAEPDQIAAAAEAGATLSTHLGNGAHGTLRRHPNYLWEQLADDRLSASIICDGHHLPDSVVKVVLRSKPPGRVILTCDASGDAGRPPGRYRSENGEVEVLDDGRIVVAGQRQFLAGSGVATDACVVGVMRAAGMPLAEAVRMATEYPAKTIGVEPVRLEPGTRADLVLFHMERGPRLHVVATVVAGEIRHGALPGEPSA